MVHRTEAVRGLEPPRRVAPFHRNSLFYRIARFRRFGAGACLSLAACLALSCVLSPAALAKPRSGYLHVRVEESGPDGDEVTVSVPVSLIMTVLPLLDEHDGTARVRFAQQEHGVGHEELAAVLDRLETVPDGEEIDVPVDDPDAEAWASRRGGELQVRIIEYDDPPARRHRGETSGGGEETLVRVPIALARAFSHEPIETEDLARAVESLGHDGGEILVVEGDEETRVRIWIDQKSGTD